VASACPLDLDTQVLRSDVSRVYSRVATEPGSDLYFHIGLGKDFRLNNGRDGEFAGGWDTDVLNDHARAPGRGSGGRPRSVDSRQERKVYPS